MGELSKREKKAAKFRAIHAAGTQNESETIPTTNDPDSSLPVASKVDEKDPNEDSKSLELASKGHKDVASPEATVRNQEEQTKKKKKKSASKVQDIGTSGDTKPTKTIFNEQGEAEQQTQEVSTVNKATKTNQKYIVFVGNMAYDVTAEMLAKHFVETCGETPKVRLLTKRADPRAFDKLSNSKKKSIAKGKAQDPTAAVSKGCAFVEFSTPKALQKGLRFHHSMFRGRQINVELTAGGGGTSETRKKKIQDKNADLEKERKKHFEQHVKPQAEAQKRKAHEEAVPREPGPVPAPSKKRMKFASGANAVRLG
ncbi:hypothetical protein MYAM1_001552 [Malassezia yamatoensis]|uniref:RRM domain-containing protein n=1 Tax=Malassezia yamatoensis TaxID=253288 RepID=A0AAJ6CGI0_9BASI|nr:hypothetical protein MYAM1_001552 [Malassezia yamatoensis]